MQWQGPVVLELRHKKENFEEVVAGDEIKKEITKISITGSAAGAETKKN